MMLQANPVRMVGGVRVRGASTSGARKPKVSKKGLQQHFEINARLLFLSAAGQFFADKLVSLGLDKRWGSLDWWLNEEYVKRFFDNLKLEKGKLILKAGRINQEINREFISAFTSIPLNPNYDPMTQVSFEKAKMFNGLEGQKLFRDIAPYARPEQHIASQQGNWLRTRGLQENQVLVAKWFKANFVGTGLRHLGDGKVGWFLNRLSFDSLGGWDACETIVCTFKNCTRKGAMPLPFLASMIWAGLKNLERGPNDIACNPSSEFALLQCDIPGYWHGSKVEDPALMPYYCDTEEKWKKWKVTHGVDALGGGWRYDWKDTLEMNVQGQDVGAGLGDAIDAEVGNETQEEVQEQEQMDVEYRESPQTGYSGYLNPGVPLYHSPEFVPYEAFKTVGYFRQIPTIEEKLNVLGDAMAIQLSLMDQDRVARGDPRPQISGADWDARDKYYRDWFFGYREATRPRSWEDEGGESSGV